MLLDLSNYGNVSFDSDYIVTDRGSVNWIKILDGREKRAREQARRAGWLKDCGI